jgi:hypothetical protein
MERIMVGGSHPYMPGDQVRGGVPYPWRVDIEVQTVFLASDFYVVGEESSLDTHRSFLASVQHTGPWFCRLWRLSTETTRLVRCLNVSQLHRSTVLQAVETVNRNNASG